MRWLKVNTSFYPFLFFSVSVLCRRKTLIRRGLSPDSLSGGSEKQGENLFDDSHNIPINLYGYEAFSLFFHSRVQNRRIAGAISGKGICKKGDAKKGNSTLTVV